MALIWGMHLRLCHLHLSVKADNFQGTWRRRRGLPCHRKVSRSTDKDKWITWQWRTPLARSWACLVWIGYRVSHCICIFCPRHWLANNPPACVYPVGCIPNPPNKNVWHLSCSEGKVAIYAGCLGGQVGFCAEFDKVLLCWKPDS